MKQIEWIDTPATTMRAPTDNNRGRGTGLLGIGKATIALLL